MKLKNPTGWYGLYCLLLIGLSFLLPACHVGRLVIWNYADFDDHKKFPSGKILNGSSKAAFQFHEARPDTANRIAPGYIEINDQKQDFESFLKERETVAFLIIRNDTVFYEKYFQGYEAEDLMTSFSVAKSFVSALMGIAIQEGYISGVKDTVSTYLPELAEQGFDSVTIENLLNMRSGSDFTEGYGSPFKDVAKYYYGRNLEKYLGQIKITRSPGDTFIYQSGNTQLLARIIEKTTGRHLSEYAEDKIWQPLGMEYPAEWSIDSKKHGTEKAFCCLNARARDFARFARLYLENGIWQGDTVISPEWIRRSTTLPSKDVKFDYYYHWWHCVNRRPVDTAYDASLTGPDKKLVMRKDKQGNKQKYVLEPCTDYFAKGILGQYIYIAPEQNLIMLRFGLSKGGFPWELFFRSYVRQLEKGKY